MVAMAAGRIVTGQYSAEQAANDWETAPGERISAAESHRTRLGIKPVPAYMSDPRNSVKHLGTQELKARGLDADRLGALLQSAKPPVRTWIVGNADTSGWRRRAALLTVDRLGVGSGMVALRSYDPRLPYGLTDNPAAIVEYATQSDAEFIVIHMGNGARAEAARPHLSESEYQAAHNEAVRLLDELVKRLTERIKAASTDILVVAPRPPSADASHPNDWNRLTPILGVGPDFPALPERTFSGHWPYQKVINMSGFIMNAASFKRAEGAPPYSVAPRLKEPLGDDDVFIECTLVRLV